MVSMDMRMKTLLTKLFFISAVLAIPSASAQTHSNSYKSFSLGILGGEYGDDTGVGIEIGTPFLFNNRVSLRARANLNWLEAYKANFDKWVKYETLTTSLTYHALVVQRVRGYVEVGALFVFPDKSFSDKKARQGLTSSIGVELFVFTDPGLDVFYYFSGGYSLVKATAEKLEDRPHYASGFVFNNGFRFYFSRP